MHTSKLFVFFAAVALTSVFAKPRENYNYRYEKSGEMLKTAASSVPYSNSYEIEEDGYFPEFTNRFRSYDFGRPKFQGALGDVNFGHSNGFNFNNGFDRFSNGYIDQPIYHNYPPISQIGGGYIDNNHYKSAKKNSGDENVAKVEAQSAIQTNHDSEGFNQGSLQKSISKGDSGYYNDQTADKQQSENGKSYHGISNYDKAGNNDASANTQNSHKKGHVTKGFKTSHRKDEEEKTETFYDEAHDVADHKNFGQNQGSFGEKSETSIKAGQGKEVIDSKIQGKEGHYNIVNQADDTRANKGIYGQSEHNNNLENLHKLNGLGEHSILAHQESSGEYSNKKPYHTLPINK